MTSLIAKVLATDFGKWVLTLLFIASVLVYGTMTKELPEMRRDMIELQHNQREVAQRVAVHDALLPEIREDVRDIKRILSHGR